MDENRRNDFGRSPGEQSGSEGIGKSTSGQQSGQRNTGGLSNQGQGGQRQSGPGQGGGRFGNQANAVAEQVRKEGEKIGQNVGQDLREEGREIAGDVRHYVEDFAQSGKKTVTERLQHVSLALHRAADTLREEEEDATGRMANQAADRIDQVCSYLDNHEPSDLLRSADRFARQQPMVVVGGLLLAGVMLGRFLRSSQRQGTDDFDKEHFRSGQDRSGSSPQYGEPRRVEVGMGIGSNPGLRPRGGSPGIGQGPEIGGRIGGKETDTSRPLTSRPLTEPPREGGPGFRGGV
jgi:hypothetical protein